MISEIVCWMWVALAAGLIASAFVFVISIPLANRMLKYYRTKIRISDEHAALIGERRIILATLAGVVAVFSITLGLLQYSQSVETGIRAEALAWLDRGRAMWDDETPSNDAAGYAFFAEAVTTDMSLAPRVAYMAQLNIQQLNPDSQSARCTFRYTVSRVDGKPIRDFDAIEPHDGCESSECIRPNAEVMLQTEVALQALGAIRHLQSSENKELVRYQVRQLSTNSPKFSGQLSFANLNFLGSDFCNSSFDNVSFRNSHLGSVQFVGAEFRNVDFQGANLLDVDFYGAIFDDQTNFTGAENINKADFACACSPSGELNGYGGAFFLGNGLDHPTAPPNLDLCRNNGSGYLNDGSRNVIEASDGHGEPGNHIWKCLAR